jgi:exopolysaccharide biosynthesis WecB/TagA/CpsF family protein
MEKYSIFGLKYCVTDYEEASDLIIEHAKIRKSFTVACLPVHGLIEAYRSKDFNKAANHIDMIVTESYPIIWALNTVHNLKLRKRVVGADLSLYVLEKANTYNLKVFLFGSREYTIRKFAEFIKFKYPNVEICGMQSDRFRESTEKEDKMDIDLINSAGAQIVFVGRGCPRQEYWINSHKNQINASMIAIGAVFDWYAGTLRRAPKWMQNLSLEWLYRFMQEPRRLWKRNLITNSYYLFLMAKFILKKKLGLLKNK